MVDFVQMVSDHLGRDLGFDEDSIHWVGVATRECVINAIKHGNQNDRSKRVTVEFETIANGVPALTISVRDQGPGFDPDALPDPLAPENLLSSSGRGIFLIRSFMDDVRLQRAEGGGMEIRMIKHAPTDVADRFAEA
jgi:serine/threonine-protein kinase RsbW